MREKTVYTLGILGTLLLLYNFYQIFLVIPIDALQGNIFRIIFIHVPAAITADCFYGVASLPHSLYEALELEHIEAMKLRPNPFVKSSG